MSRFKENDVPFGKPENHDRELYYTIGAVSEMYGIHPQTLRLYDREGLLTPTRTTGNTRHYSRDDLKKLEIILRLTRELGVNRAGTDIILDMREKLEEFRDRVNEMLRFILKELSRDVADIDEKFKHAVNRAPGKDLFRIDLDARDYKKEKGE